MEYKQSEVEVAIVENLFRQKAPVHSPLEQELATEFKRSTEVGVRILN